MPLLTPRCCKIPQHPPQSYMYDLVKRRRLHEEEGPRREGTSWMRGKEGVWVVVKENQSLVTEAKATRASMQGVVSCDPVTNP